MSLIGRHRTTQPRWREPCLESLCNQIRNEAIRRRTTDITQALRGAHSSNDQRMLAPVSATLEVPPLGGEMTLSGSLAVAGWKRR